MKNSVVHYRLDFSTGGSVRSYEQLLEQHRAACKPHDVTTEPRSPFPRCVTCPACLDWMAKNYKTVIANVAEMRGAA